MRATQGLAGVVGLFLFSVPAQAQVTSRVSVSTSGAQANGESGIWYGEGSSLSADGRFVAFYSSASNLVGGDTNGAQDVFVHDRLLGTTERSSVATNGAQSNADSYRPALSGDGRYVAFNSLGNMLVAGDTNGTLDVFVHDRQLGTTERVSLSSTGTQGNGDSGAPTISADGRYVAFWSRSDNLVPGDTNYGTDLFVRDRLQGTTELVDVDSAGAQSSGDVMRSAISADGRWVVFGSTASDLVPNDTNGVQDIFVHDRQSGATERVSVDSSGLEANNDSRSLAISADGRFVAFASDASNLVTGDTNGVEDVFLRDRLLGTTERVSVGASGAEGQAVSNFPALSADGRYLAFSSAANNLAAGDQNPWMDILVLDRSSGVLELASVATDGAPANMNASYPAISSSGRVVAFVSRASSLVGADTNGADDIFARDLEYTVFASHCDPAAGGVLACPCANPSGAPGRGCDNSAGTGGAQLEATGVAYLSQDTLALRTSGQLTADLSIVLQGNAEIPGGQVFGQGVRCAGGTLKRLYVKTSVSGGIVAPDPAAGDPAVSLRSAQLGDGIQAGESRWYLVYYRDPIVLGACPATSTFNATQTGSAIWWP
jgi:Tol biopolymer transport system component